MAGGGESVRLRFRRDQRLTHARQFESVYEAKVRKSRAPLVVFARPNEVGRFRLGLSVGRAVGTAVARNRIKRLLREAFRLDHRAWPRESEGGYDLVVTVRPHRPLPLEAYREVLGGLAGELHREWERRRRREADSGTEER